MKNINTHDPLVFDSLLHKKIKILFNWMNSFDYTERKKNHIFPVFYDGKI